MISKLFLKRSLQAKSRHQINVINIVQMERVQAHKCIAAVLHLKSCITGMHVYSGSSPETSVLQYTFLSAESFPVHRSHLAPYVFFFF